MTSIEAPRRAPGPLSGAIPDALEGFTPARPNPFFGRKCGVPQRILPPSFYGIFRDLDEARHLLAASVEAREFNYYVTWRDVQGFGLMATFAEWVGEGHPHVNRIDGW